MFNIYADCYRKRFLGEDFLLNSIALFHHSSFAHFIHLLISFFNFTKRYNQELTVSENSNFQDSHWHWNPNVGQFCKYFTSKILSVLFQVEYNDPESDWMAASSTSILATNCCYDVSSTVAECVFGYSFVSFFGTILNFAT